jgi:hypothetical protein
MPNQEILRSPEKKTLINPEPTEALDAALTQEDIELMFAARTEVLESIRSNVCLSFFYAVSEKLAKERSSLMDILNLNDKKHELLERYSFVLSPQYFEQKFLEK